jgi:zinc D-Ala-D-Ala carboxypeptidase
VERREILKIFSAGTIAAMSGQLVFRARPAAFPLLSASPVFEDIDTSAVELARSIQYMTTPAPDSQALLNAFRRQTMSLLVDSGNMNAYLQKMENFENSHYEDVYLESSSYKILVSTFQRLGRVQNLVGHGNFNVLGFDEMLKYSKRYGSVGAFPKTESDFLEHIFTASAKQYGFFGDKVVDNLTRVVPAKDRKKMPRTGHFLYRGESEALYKKVRKDLGATIVLTSGIRNVVKQTHLFLAKTIQSKGNLSRASRSLAPPGHSYHGIGDFDVGKVGFGSRNFTADFSKTKEFQRLVDLGYVDMRYPLHNLLGVRYEPWHIKVVAT